LRTRGVGGGGAGRRTPEVPEAYESGCEEGASGVEERVPRRSGAAGDEGLVNFVEAGVTRSDGERGEGPGPAPAFAVAAEAAKEEEIEDEVVGEVGGLAQSEIQGI